MADLDDELERALSESEATASDSSGSSIRSDDPATRNDPASRNDPATRDEEAAAVPSGVTRDAQAEPRKRGIGLLAALLVVGGGILTLVFTSFDSAAIYSVTTDELLAKKEQLEGRTVRVEGNLVKGSLRHRAEPCEYRFVIEKDDARLPVRYPECVVPDTFRDVPDMDVQVTAEGELVDGGYLEASHIMAKCPSKYEMREKAAAGEEAPHTQIGTAPDAPPIID